LFTEYVILKYLLPI
ncbi:TPA: stress response small protein YobI, partial [Shigella sonnei]